MTENTEDVLNTLRGALAHCEQAWALLQPLPYSVIAPQQVLSLDIVRLHLRVVVLQRELDEMGMDKNPAAVHQGRLRSHS